MPLVVYSAQRLALFLAALAALYALRMGGWLLVVVAAVVAWALSYVLLGRSRDAAALWLHERVSGRRTGRFGAGLAADAQAEDAEAARTSEGQAEAEQDSVGQLEEPGAGEHGTQQRAAGAEQDGAGQHGGREREQQHEQ